MPQNNRIRKLEKGCINLRTNRQIDDLGFVYLCESTDESVSHVGDLKIYDKNNIFFVEFDSVLQSFGVKNRNQRYYTADNVWAAIQTPKIQDLLAHDSWFGEQNHPTQEFQDKKLSTERIRDVWMPNRSHKIMKPRIEGNLLKAKIQTDAGTDAGIGFAKTIIQGMVPRFSCRSIATLKMINGKPTVVVRLLITYDWVFYPSHPEAEMIGNLEKPIVESVQDEPKNITPEDTFIPLEEILDLVGNKDVNTEILLESFDLGIEDLVGFNKERTHAIIKDRDNMIYAKIRPETKKKVDDFFASF